MKYLPALKVAIIFSVGITIGEWNAFRIEYLLIGSFLLLISSISLDRHLIANLLLVASLLLASIALYKASLPPSGFPAFDCQIEGTVTQSPRLIDTNISFPVKLNSIQISADDVFKSDSKLWVRSKLLKYNVKAGDHVKITGVLSCIPQKRNPGDFDYKKWSERNGFIGIFNVAAPPEINKTGQVSRVKYKVINRISDAIDECFKENASLVKALIIGIRSDLDPSFTEALRSTGLSHLIALSGLHVGFIVVLLFTFGVILRLKLAWRIALIMIGIIIYIQIVPFRASTLRAVVMTLILISGPVLKRWSHVANSLSVAALIVLILRPGDLFDAGFQLSFSAVTGILLLMSVLDSVGYGSLLRSGPLARIGGRYIVTPFLISCAASIMTFPLTSYYFSTMAFGAPLFNLIAVPLLAFIFASSLFSIIVFMAFPALGLLLADGAGLVITVWKSIVFLFAEYSPISGERLFPIAVMLLLVFFIMISLARTSWRFKAVTTVLFIILVFTGHSYAKNINRFRCLFLDVGHGDAALLFFPEGHTLVVDAGPKPTNKTYSEVLSTLKYFNRRTIDLLAASHFEADHFGGMIPIIGNLHIGLAIAPALQSNSLTFKELMERSKEKGLTWKRAYTGSKVEGLPNRYELKILNPPNPIENLSLNNASLVMKLTVKHLNSTASTLLLTGDIEMKTEIYLTGRENLCSSLLKVPHHGSQTSSTDMFIDAVNPSYAVISKGNRYETAGRLKTSPAFKRISLKGINVFSTNKSGAVMFEASDRAEDAGWKIVDWRNPTFLSWLFGNC